LDDKGNEDFFVRVSERASKSFESDRACCGFQHAIVSIVEGESFLRERRLVGKLSELLVFSSLLIRRSITLLKGHVHC
jgi:hypothetical protein